MASSSSDTATLQAQLAEARAEAEKAKKSAMRWKSKHDAVKEATRAAAQAAADLGTEGFVIDEKELLCSVCYQLGQVGAKLRKWKTRLKLPYLDMWCSPSASIRLDPPS